MIHDAQNLFSDVQAITAAAASTNVVDLGEARDIGTGSPLYIVVTVDVAFTDAGSDSTLTVDLQGDTVVGFGTAVSQRLFIMSALAAVGDVYIGRINPGPGAGDRQFIRVFYTPNNGNLTTGSVTAFLTHNIQKFKAYAKGYTIS